MMFVLSMNKRPSEIQTASKRLPCFPAGLRFADDGFGFFNVAPVFHFGRARFFQVFVVVEVELDLFDQLLRQIGQSFVGVAVVAVVGRNADDFVVHFRRRQRISSRR